MFLWLQGYKACNQNAVFPIRKYISYSIFLYRIGLLSKFIYLIINNLQKSPEKLTDFDYDQLKNLVVASMDVEIDLSTKSIENTIWVQNKGKEILLGDLEKFENGIN